jgi:hypothetical protein
MMPIVVVKLLAMDGCTPSGLPILTKRPTLNADSEFDIRCWMLGVQRLLLTYQQPSSSAQV